MQVVKHSEEHYQEREDDEIPSQKEFAYGQGSRDQTQSEESDSDEVYHGEWYPRRTGRRQHPGGWFAQRENVGVGRHRGQDMNLNAKQLLG